MGCREAAAEVLRRAGRPLHLSEITRLIREGGLCKVGGRKPQETVGARIFTDIQRKGKASAFIRVSPAVFKWNPRVEKGESKGRGKRRRDGEVAAGLTAEDVSRLVRLASRNLRQALDLLWPTHAHRPEPERNLVFWFAHRLADEDFFPVFEVNFLGEDASRLDLAAVRRRRGTADVVLCESKIIFGDGDAAAAVQDFKRLRSFNLRRHGLPESRARCVVLLSTWREKVKDWWLDPNRGRRLLEKGKHPGWDGLREQVERPGVALAVVDGGKFEESNGKTTQRWILIATWKR